jgi:hypothetical protein
MTAGMAFAEALRTLNTMKAEGVIEEYAIAGAMALVCRFSGGRDPVFSETFPPGSGA